MKKLLAVVTGFLMVLTAFSVIGIAHINPQGKSTHPVGIETESCQDALAGAGEQLADRGDVNPHLLANIEDKCGVEECSIVSDAAREPVLVCGDCFLTEIRGKLGFICGEPVPPPIS